MSKSIRSFVCCLLIACCASTVRGDALEWDNTSTDQLWSTGTNWNADQAGAPGALDTITFTDVASAGTAGTVTNIVDVNVTVSGLSYLNDNATGNGIAPAKFHTTQINNGATLTVTGPVLVGGNNFVGTTANIAGPGTLTVNSPSSNMIIDQGGNNHSPAHTVILNMSGLSTFNATLAKLEVGKFGGGTKTLQLAANNTVTADEISIGLNGWNATSTLEMGQTNEFNANLFNISGTPNPQSSTATLLFRTGLTNPTVQLRDKTGTGRANVVAGHGGHTSGDNTGHLDFTNGIVDALFEDVQLGIGSPGTLDQSRAGVGIITMGAGTIDANSMTLGRAALTALQGTTSGTVNLNGPGSLSVGLLTMTNRPSGTAGPVSATVNIGGGATLAATTIQRGFALGTGTATIALNFNNGTLRNRAGTDLTINSEVPVSILTAGTHNIHADAGRTVTINSVLSGAGTGVVNKVGGGTLLLNGANTYTAATQVTAGTLGGNGSLTSAVTVGSGATISPGASAGILTVGALNMQDGSTLEIEIGGTTPGIGGYDRLVVTNNATLGGELKISIANFSVESNDSFIVLSAGSVTGVFSNAPTSGSRVAVEGTNGTFLVTYLSSQVMLSNFQVPEPSSISLLAIGTVLLVRRRKRG